MVYDIETLNQWLQLLGIPVAVGVFIHAKWRERIDRQVGTFSALADRYNQFLRLCFDNPDLPIFGWEYPENVLDSLSAQDKRRVQIAFCELIGLLEQAHLLYSSHKGSRMHREQWDGWLDYAKDYFRNPAFNAFWPELSKQFDKRFLAELRPIAGPK